MAFSGVRTETLGQISADLKSRVGSAPIFKKVVSKYWYPFMTRRIGEDNVVFLNWGYEEDPPMGLPLTTSDEPSRYNIQLYHRTATQADLTGKEVLEVSCGHGGGASYLMRTLQPASCTGLDFNPDGIAFCQRKHDLRGLDFVHGDAEDLPFPDESFDAVINVEASHNYLHFSRFLTEVARVLRPGGHFLYADVRLRGDIPAWEATMAESPLQMQSKKVIDEQVLRGLEMNSPRSLDLIGRHLPGFLQRFGREFAGVQGSPSYRNLQDGKMSYRMYSFTK